MVASARPSRPDVRIVVARFRGHRFSITYRDRGFALGVLVRWCFHLGLLSLGELRELWIEVRKGS